VPECFKDDNASQWKWENSTYAPSESPEPIVNKICKGDYVQDPYRYAKFHNDMITLLRPPNMRKCASSDSANFLLVLPSAYTAKTLAPIFTINTSNHAVSRKDVPFGGREKKILHFYPIFPQKRKFLANYRRDLKNFASKRP